jgi:hypothetical protein
MAARRERMRTRGRAATIVLAGFAVFGAALAAQELRYGTGTWEPDRYGNHRVVLKVAAPADAVWAHIAWRRRDAGPEKKNLIVVDSKSGMRVNNVARPSVTREAADIVFQARSAGEYDVYYLPYTGTVAASYPKITYPPPEATADGAWLASHIVGAGKPGVERWRLLPRAQVVEIQAVDDVDSFFPMEVVATAEEMRGLVSRFPRASYLVFPEDRKFPIRMADDLPLRWITRGPGGPFSGEAERGEFYAFQLGIYALQPIEDLDVTFSGLTGPSGKIEASSFRCINLGGMDWMSRPFRRTVAIGARKVQPLWCGFQVPEAAPAGKYAGTVTVVPKGMEKTSVSLALTVTPRVIAAAGDDEPWRLSRLRWLDSTLAVDDDLVPPYAPVTVDGRSVAILGRLVTLDDLGFPKTIESWFSPEMTGFGKVRRPILTAPVRLVVEDGKGQALAWSASGFRFTKQAPGAAAWEANGTAGPVTISIVAQMEFDGDIEYAVALKADAPVTLRDVRLEIPIARDVARYMMGLNVKGGARPATYLWTWNPKNNQDSAWVGDVNAGLQFTLKDDKYVRPLNTNFYQLKPLVMPASWWNGGAGGCRLADGDRATWLVSCYSGPRTMAAGEIQHYDFRLLVTPFKPIDPKAQFSTRYLHAYKPITEVRASGANTVNIHHATEINPFINYPFLRAPEMKAYVDEAHRNGVKVKIYYTVRELSTRAPELFALRSLGDEVLAGGPGGGFSWLQEHLGGNYIAGWFVPSLRDAAVINSGVSRWHNYYVEGVNWLVKNVGIDGLYLDDVAFDRTTMKRVRKVLDRGRPGALIDLHSANQYNPRDGFASSANLYLEHFPYLNRLWFGEYFDYNAAPDFWLVEMSGIPFGLMGEMLQDGGNPWRGMVFGMTGRLPRVDNGPLWKAWDDFGIAEARMIGYWVDSAPVKTGNPQVLATSYVRDGRTLVALASWAPGAGPRGRPPPTTVRLAIDWGALGLDPKKATLTAPAIANFQEAASFRADGEIPIEAGKGMLLVIR